MDTCFPRARAVTSASVPSEPINIGDLPALQNYRAMPPEVGDIRVQRIYDRYRDEHFKDGWALRMINALTLEELQQLIEVDSRRRALNAVLNYYGACQIPCPDLRERMLRCIITVQRSGNLSLHKDGMGISATDTLLTGFSRDWPSEGATLVTTNRLALVLLLEHGGYPSVPSARHKLLQEIHSIFTCGEYAVSDGRLNAVLRRCGEDHRRATAAEREEFLDQVEGFTGVLACRWDTHEALAFSNKRTAHARGNRAHGSLTFRYV